MNKLKVLILTCLSIYLFAGCTQGGSKAKSFDANRVRVDGNQINSGGAFRACDPYGEYVGSVYTNKGYENLFNSATQYFLTSIDDPSYFGRVDGSCGSDTGIAIKGQVRLAGAFNRNGNNYGDVDTNSSVSILIMDTLAVNNQELSPISIIASSGGYGYVDGDVAEVELKWERGSIIFSGVINYQSNEFTGKASFNNFYHFNGEDPWNGEFGYFSIPICNFFVCQ